ncbi:MAG: sigma 54-interacting transcriptional regulator [Bacteroidota bacterium]
MKEKILIVEDELIVAKDLEYILANAGYSVSGIAVSVVKARQMIEAEIPDLVLLDIYLKGDLTGIDLAADLNEKNIAFVYLSANSNQSVLESAKQTRPYGFLVKPFREEDVLIALDIARFRHQNNLETDLQKEYLLEKRLSSVHSPTATIEKNFLSLIMALQPYIPFDFLEIGRVNKEQNDLDWRGFLRIGFQEYQTISSESLQTIARLNGPELENLRKGAAAEALQALYNGADYASLMGGQPIKELYARVFNVRSSLVLPLLVDHGMPVVVSFYSKSENAYQPAMLHLLGRIQQSLISVISKTIATNTSSEAERNTALLAGQQAVSENGENYVFPGVVGKSHPLLLVLDYVKQVAVVDTSVLILGETGTGKEKIAHHIHDLSPRKNKPLIKVNCAALPSSLIESELFGHEKGAFTGAVSKRIGRFEQANGGTLFLDEIGDLPPDVQVKLLRVLQEKEIDRIGGSETIAVDVRIVAATNKNLEKEIAEGRLRMDLFYRLNVFPIMLPPLRSRTEDIPLLVNHFIKLFSEKHHKQINGITKEGMSQLMRYDWPGNVRELENTIERSVVLAKNKDLDNVYIHSPQVSPAGQADSGYVKTIDEVEREHIQNVLGQCNYKVYGPGGAAELLNLPPSTLTSKMKKLGIMKP